MDGATMELVLRESGGSESRTIRFEPVYFSIADEFAEAYSGLQRDDDATRLEGVSGHAVANIGRRIGIGFPSSAENFDNLRAYCLNAMEWNIRFVCQGAPEVEVSAA